MRFCAPGAPPDSVSARSSSRGRRAPSAAAWPFQGSARQLRCCCTCWAASKPCRCGSIKSSRPCYAGRGLRRTDPRGTIYLSGKGPDAAGRSRWRVGNANEVPACRWRRLRSGATWSRARERQWTPRSARASNTRSRIQRRAASMSLSTPGNGCVGCGATHPALRQRLHHRARRTRSARAARLAAGPGIGLCRPVLRSRLCLILALGFGLLDVVVFRNRIRAGTRFTTIVRPNSTSTVAAMNRDKFRDRRMFPARRPPEHH